MPNLFLLSFAAAIILGLGLVIVASGCSGSFSLSYGDEHGYTGGAFIGRTPPNTLGMEE